MIYQKTLDYLFSQLPVFQKEGATAYKPGLETAEKLDAWLHHPHRRYACLHIAGTNGKGSVSHLTASVLQAAGLRTGLFTSPHLKDFRERMRVNGAMISEADVIDFVTRYRQQWEGRLQASFFEVTTMMAFEWFARESVDVAVIEVGLGGRLDTTNIITPTACAITNISFDHMAQLGNTLESIATEKAGIIKPGVPVVVGQAEGKVKRVFERQATSLNAPCYFAQDIYNVFASETDTYNHYTVYEGGAIRYSDMPCALKGAYQAENLTTVLSLLKCLPASWNINEQTIREGFKQVVEKTGLRGRWETLDTNPLIICDTGHNEGGLRHVVKQLMNTPHHTLRIVLGMVGDKDVDAALAVLPPSATYYFTQASIPRALPATDLACKAGRFGLNGQSYSSVDQALAAAKSESRPDDLIFVGGSTFVVAEVL
jgi:dihydrofolate synthase/folylpolyglutamate synthase